MLVFEYFLFFQMTEVAHAHAADAEQEGRVRPPRLQFREDAVPGAILVLVSEGNIVPRGLRGAQKSTIPLCGETLAPRTDDDINSRPL